MAFLEYYTNQIKREVKINIQIIFVNINLKK